MSRYRRRGECVGSPRLDVTFNTLSTRSRREKLMVNKAKVSSRRTETSFKGSSQRYPRLTDWVEAQIGETLNFYRLPRQHHKHLKSTNLLERLNEEIKRRTRVVRIKPKPGELPAIDPGAVCRNPRSVARRSPLSEHGVPEGAEERPAPVRCVHTHLFSMGVHNHAWCSALAHVVQNKVEAYARSDLFERRRRLMDDWSSAIKTKELIL